MASPSNSFFHRILFIFAGNKHMHKNLNKVEFLPDPTADWSYLPLSTKKSTFYLVATLAPSFLIGSISFFQVTRTIIKTGQSSNWGQIGPRAVELAALEQIEKSP